MLVIFRTSSNFCCILIQNCVLFYARVVVAAGVVAFMALLSKIFAYKYFHCGCKNFHYEVVISSLEPNKIITLHKTICSKIKNLTNNKNSLNRFIYEMLKKNTLQLIGKSHSGGCLFIFFEIKKFKYFFPKLIFDLCLLI